jgi:hypothetical protein
MAQTGPDLSITITGRHQTRDGLPTDNALFVQLGVQPRSSGYTGASGTSDVNGELLPVQVENEYETAPYGDVPLDPLERDDATSDATSENGRRRRRDALTQAEVEKSSAPFVLSPRFVREAVDAALSAQAIHSSLGRLESLASRSRTSALLPEVRFRAGRDVDQSLRLAPTADDPYRYTQTGGVSFIIEGAATFRLSRLLFANEELGIERLRLAQARESRRVTEVLLDELVVWQKAYRVLFGTSLPSSRALNQVRESSLRLDVLTGGWFSEHEPTLPKEPKVVPAAQSLGAPRSGNLTVPTVPVVEPTAPMTPRVGPRRPVLKRTTEPRQAESSSDGAEAGELTGVLVKLSTSR